MEKSVFVEYVWDYPLIRILDFLILSRDTDYSMTEIVKNSGVGWSSFSEIWPKLVGKNIVELTRTIGNAKLYKLNLNNHWVKELIRMDRTTTRIETEELFSKKQKIAA